MFYFTSNHGLKGQIERKFSKSRPKSAKFWQFSGVRDVEKF